MVPRTASVWYYFRETDYPNIKNMWDIGNRMADAVVDALDAGQVVLHVPLIFVFKRSGKPKLVWAVLLSNGAVKSWARA